MYHLQNAGADENQKKKTFTLSIGWPQEKARAVASSANFEKGYRIINFCEIVDRVNIL